MPRRLTEEDMLDRIDFHGEGGCWVWTGPVNQDGYGRVSYSGQYAASHRWVYEKWVEPIPDDMQLDHVCLNTGCCNPDHLEVVTHVVNLQRRRPKARHAKRYFPETTPKLYRQIVAVMKDRHGDEWKAKWPSYVPWTVEGEPRPIVPEAED